MIDARTNYLTRYARLAIALFSAFVWLLALPGQARAESVERLNSRGMRAYEKGEYNAAIDNFRRAGEKKPDDLVFDYNQAAALASDGKLEEAKEIFEKVANARDQRLANAALYGQGVVSYQLSKQKADEAEMQAASPPPAASSSPTASPPGAAPAPNPLQEALEHAKDSVRANCQVLRADPKDNDARLNLEMAARLRKMIERRLQQQQQQNQDQNKKDGEENKDEKSDKKDKDGNEEKDQDKNEEEKKQDQQDQKDQKDQQDKQDQKDQENQDKQDEKEKQEGEKEEKEEEKKGEKPEEKEEGKEEKSPSEPDKEKEPPPPEENATMSILNLLDDNDVEALKRMLKRRYGRLPPPEKDW